MGRKGGQHEMTRTFRARRFIVAAVLILGLVAALNVRAVTPAKALTQVTLIGHGFGHGRGAGQYGSLGYAQGGWNSTQILEHYYGGTAHGTTDPNQLWQVRLTARDDQSTIVYQERGQMVTNADDSLPGGRVGRTALRVERVAAGTWAVYDGPSCDGPWTRRAANVHLPNVVMAPMSRSEDLATSLQLCERPGVRRWYFGDLVAVEADGKQYTSNTVPIDQYVRGVVPREMPASWGDYLGGKGMEALKVQAVAARSYALAERRYSFAKTCDTTACQVYGGRAVHSGGTFTNLEDSRSNNAVASTSGHVRLLNGQIARTEYSSSTGGYTAGGTFPAVFDEGDAIAVNPYHNWTHTIPASSIEAHYNKGSLLAAAVTQRNGLGRDGGRVVNLRLSFSGGNIDVSGTSFAAAFGLRSNWFSVDGATSGKFVPLVPARILDSRPGEAATDDWSSPWPANSTRAVQVAGRGGVPAGATAVALNVTVVNPTAPSGYLTAFPSDAATPPTASNINFRARTVVPNLVIVKLGGDGAIKIYNSPGGNTDVIADVVGYFGSQAQSTDGRFVPISPTRILDSRPGEPVADDWNTPWPANTSRNVAVAGRATVPVDAIAVVLNITVTNTTGAGYLTAWPTGSARPQSSNLNWVPGQTVPNRVFVKLGAAGQLALYNSSGSTDVIADVVGYFTSPAAASSSNGIFHPLTPVRILDSRPGEGAPDEYASPWPANGQRRVRVANLLTLPPSMATVVLNVTVVNPTGSGYLTLFPSGSPPNASDLNFTPQLVVANLAPVRVHTDGTVQIYNSPAGTTDVVADATGYFS